MTLHEAMIIVLKENMQGMTGSEISDIIFSKKLYLQKNGNKAPRSQIELRAKNYPQYFLIQFSTPKIISLIED